MDGYPDDALLERIRQWDIHDKRGVLELLVEEWYYPERAREVRPGLFAFSTGGWSGNEDLLGALYESKPWFVMAWNAIKVPGGLLCVAVDKSAQAEMSALHDRIVDWCWKEAE